MSSTGLAAAAFPTTHLRCSRLVAPVRPWLLLWLSCLVCVLAPGVAQAERTTDLSGYVTDPAGVPIGEAEVRVLGTTISTLSEEDGFFQLERVPPGDPTLHVWARGHVAWTGPVSVPGADVGGLEIALVPQTARPDGWAQTYSETQRFGSDVIRHVPARLRGHGAEVDGMFAARASVQSNGHFDPEVGSEAFHLGALELGGRSENDLFHYFLATSGASMETTPRHQAVLRDSPFGFFPSWTDELESGNLRARFQLLPGDSYSLTADLDYSAASGRSYAHMWSRPGYVQTFLDTLQQTGEIVLRHGRYSPTRIDQSYEWFDPRDHLPTEEERSFSLRAAFDQQLSEELRYVAHVSYVRHTLDSRVADKKAWEYEGERSPDFWFNYTDRVVGEFFVIANDFPRLAEGEQSRVAGGVDLRQGGARTPLHLGFALEYRDAQFFEILRPYSRDVNGEIGGVRTRYHEFHPSYSGHVRKAWEIDELHLRVGLEYEAFHLLEALPIEPSSDGLEHQLMPRFELTYPLGPRVDFAFLGERTIRRPSPGYPAEYSGEIHRVSGLYLAEEDLVVESAVGFRAALNGRVGDRNRVELALYYEDTADRYRAENRSYFGDVGTRPYLVNGRSTQARGVQLQIARSFDERFGGTIRYTFGEVQTPDLYGSDSHSFDDDVRHRLELSLDLGNPGVLWTSTRLNYASGLPYTPDHLDWFLPEDENSRRLPATATIDIDVERQLDVWGQRVSLFFQGRNVLDTQNIADLDPLNWPGPPGAIGNEYMIYYTETGWTGGAYLTNNGPEENSGEWVPVNDPRVLGAPRDLRFGLAISF